MNNRLYIFYNPLLYASILLFILGEGTIFIDFIKSRIPGYSHTVISSILIMTTIFFGFTKGMNKKIIGEIISIRLYLAILPIILFLLASYIDVIINLFSSEVNASYIAFFIRHLLFVFLIFQAIACGLQFDNVAKPYYHFMGFILITGGVLFILSILLDNVINNTVDISYLRKVNEGNLNKDLYSMPFGLGLLITGQNLASIFGFEFYQFSSYFFEPQIFGFFMVPAFLVFLQNNIGPERTYNFYGILLAIILIAWAHSFTTISALIGVIMLWIFLRNAISAIFILLLSALILIFIISNLDQISLSLSLINKITSSSGNTSIDLFMSIFQQTSLFGDGVLNIRIGERREHLSVFSLFFWGLFIISVLLNAINEILSNKNSAFGYALLFLWICFFKTLWHLPQSPISIYLCLIYLAFKFTYLQTYFYSESTNRLSNS